LTPQGNLEKRNVEEANYFSKDLADVFQPLPSDNEPEEEEVLIQLLDAPANSNRQSNASRI
jgi:hypothetical protein